MKIIIGADSFDHNKYAKEFFKTRMAANRRRGEMPLIGINSNICQYHHICEDCNQSYFDRNEYGFNHPGCKGSLNKKLGF